jgi:hypothetical protein
MLRRDRALFFAISSDNGLDYHFSAAKRAAKQLQFCGPCDEHPPEIREDKDWGLMGAIECMATPRLLLAELKWVARGMPGCCLLCVLDGKERCSRGIFCWQGRSH